MTLPSAARILVDQLKAQGVRRVTCVPGESYLAVLDALYESGIEVLSCRNEGGAAIMAEAQGKLTGRPGICFVTRGPGATNASHGVHIAMQDSTPMILFVGQVESGMREREAFQELDYKAVFGSMAKWVVEIDSAARMAEHIAHAFRVAMQGRPGPVVVALPEDVLVQTAEAVTVPYIEPARAAPAAEDIARLQALLSRAERPLAIIGGSGWDEGAAGRLAAFAERFDLPVASSFRRASIFPAGHPNYAGDLGIGPDPRLKAMVADADLIILIGGRLSEMPSASYTLLDIPVPSQKLVHVHPGAEELGHVYHPVLAIQAGPIAFTQAMADLRPSARPPWAGRAAQAHADYLDWSGRPRTLPGDFQFGRIVRELSDRLPPDTIICNGAGNYAGWLHRHHRFGAFGSQLAPTSGSMGYGVPAAVIAKAEYPSRTVIAYAGDGCFLMNGQEFATAVQYDLPIIVIVVDNGQYGTIRMHQENHYPGRVIATQLSNPDFAAYARAFGGHGETVRTTGEFFPAFERAVASRRPAILHCFLHPDAQSHARDFVPPADGTPQ
ncbi:thiamine pyrophosphate-binding protein [Rhizobium puerariae]|uniref:Thiamine pyrophosphate-binding protein n=1 Tax=Rhizobium puerariae TaxID=1585791 RepID=A0ABV6AH64_9HYPH